MKVYDLIKQLEKAPVLADVVISFPPNYEPNDGEEGNVWCMADNVEVFDETKILITVYGGE